MTRIDLGAVWQDAMALGRRNAELIVPLAGMFLLLPGLVSTWFLPPVQTPRDAELATLVELMNGYMAAYWPYLLAHVAVVGTGTLAILALLLRADRPTVAQSLRIAALALPLYLLASLAQSLVLGVGFMALFVPGLYLVGRTALIAPLIAVEGGGNPLAALARSFAATRGNGWRIFVLLAVILVVGFVLRGVGLGLLAMALTLLVGGELAMIVTGVVGGILNTLIALATLLATAALYRRLTVLPLMTPMR